jgi:hypothetical protein
MTELTETYVVTDSSSPADQTVTNNLEHITGMVQEKLSAILEEKRLLTARLRRLESLGMTDATPHYREGKYLYLIHPMVNGERVREYIGADPKRIETALAMVERNRLYHEEVKPDLEKINYLLRSVSQQLYQLLTSLGYGPWMVQSLVKGLTEE